MNTDWRKAYVFSADFKTAPSERNVREVQFTSTIKNAMHYLTRDDAQLDVGLIFEGLIEIETVDGYKHKLRNFKVEERAPKEFVISVEGPFHREDPIKP